MKKICVLGMGYIGLPTACVLANSGFSILGVDINDEIIARLNSGKVHIDEPEIENLFSRAFNDNKIRISKKVEECDIYIIAVPTPLQANKKADLSYVISATEMIKDNIKKNDLVILESTSPPGTTRNIVGKIIQEASKLSAGKDYSLAFCPERVLPGKILFELINNDRIIGGIDEQSSRRALEIYSSFVKGKILLTDLETAEIVKLTENTFRDINIAFSNELAQICSEHKVNVWEVIEYANMHPRVNILNPGPGVGGHCIPLDPWFLIEGLDRKDSIIAKSRVINDTVPELIAQRIVSILAEIKGPKVTFFGLSYKENIGDIRESPVSVIRDELLKNGIEVAIYDPLVNNNENKYNDLKKSLQDSDLILLAVGHKVFKEISLKEIAALMRNKNIFDTRNFYDRKAIKSSGFNYYSI